MRAATGIIIAAMGGAFLFSIGVYGIGKAIMGYKQTSTEPATAAVESEVITDCMVLKGWVCNNNFSTCVREESITAVKKMPRGYNIYIPGNALDISCRYLPD
jgi:hypothetical protein